jgi:hypothetical protein
MVGRPKGSKNLPKPIVKPPEPEQIVKILPRASGDFPTHLVERMDECIQKGVELGYFTLDYIESVHTKHPDIPPEQLRAEILRSHGLKNFRFYAEVINRFPLRRNNKRLIVKPDGSSFLKDAPSIYEEFCTLMSFAEYEKKKYTQFSIPRDLMKTTISVLYKGWQYLRNTILLKRPPYILFLCHKQEFAKQNLKLCMQTLSDELVAVLYGDVLSTDIEQSVQVRFKLPGSEYCTIKRRESNFMTGGIEMSYESVHVTYIHADDVCSWENVNTPEKNQNIRFLFNNLDHLNDNSGFFRIDLVCTMHYEDDVNAMFIEQQWGPYLSRGAEDILDDGTKVYNFPEVKDYLPEALELTRKKSDQKSFYGNVLMKPSKRQSRIEITDPLPDYYDPFKEEHHDPVRHVFLTLDPAYSSKRKKQGCLQALLLLVNTRSGKLFAHDGYLTRGLSPVETIDRIATLIRNNKAQELIVETNAMQGWIATSIQEQLQKMGITIILTTAFSSQDKTDNIIAFIEPLMRREKLYIAPHLSELVNEIYGKSKYVDGMDALAFSRFSRYIDLSDQPPIQHYTDEERYNNETREEYEARSRMSALNRVSDWIE